MPSSKKHLKEKSLSGKIIAEDKFSAEFIRPDSRLHAALEVLRQKYDFLMPQGLPTADHKTKGEISVNIRTAKGQKINLRVPYTSSPLIEISSGNLEFDIEDYRKRVAGHFRTN